MKRVAIVTDSSACLPRELIERYEIEVVPIVMAFEGRVYQDGTDAFQGEFYDLLRHANHPPTTSAPTPGVYLEAYRKLSQRAESVLCITVSPHFSAMFEAASVARDLAQQVLPHTQIAVVDSQSAAMAQGFVVLAAARCAETGADLEQAIVAANDVASRVALIAMVDTLEYLARSGRIPRLAAWVGSLLDLKPIFQLTRGEVILVERSRTRHRAEERLISLVEEQVGRGNPVHVAVMHADAAEEAQKLYQRLVETFCCQEIYVTEFTPVMGAHTGPGLLAIAYYCS